MNNLWQLDNILYIKHEQIAGQGEDSSFFDGESRKDINYVMAGVFDGCGGLGSKHYPLFENHTGAYIASRVVAGATQDWFATRMDPSSKNLWTSQLKTAYSEALQRYKMGDNSKLQIKGSMTKDFPTTAICALISYGTVSTNATVDFIWAGDSRGYILTGSGLYLLTKDDVSGEDALSNIKNDGVLTNVISASGRFELHQAEFVLPSPCMVICATDGCFNYLESPIHFEYTLLKNLVLSQNAQDWENRIKQSLLGVAGDDFTMTIMIQGYDTFENMKVNYIQRVAHLEKNYIALWADTNEQEHQALWTKYRSELENA